MHILVFGADGMLGKYICTYLRTKDHVVQKMTRENFDFFVESRSGTFLETLRFILSSIRPEYVINCSGITNKRNVSVSEMYFVNSYFPIQLAHFCNELNIGLIHATTDCVFSGKKGNYSKKDYPDACDDYGLSKHLGEMLPFTENSKLTVLRTSIVGEEIKPKGGLLSWFLSHKSGDKIKGYTNHLWNGITCLEYAKIVNKIISEKGWNGIFSIRSSYRGSSSMSKYELLLVFNQVYQLNLEVDPTQAENSIDRTLNADFITKDIVEQVKEQQLFSVYLQPNIFNLPCKFALTDPELVLITSAIYPRSNTLYTPEERFNMTLKTIQSCRKNLPQAKIALVEASRISNEMILTLSKLCDYVILAGQDDNLQQAQSFGINLGETSLTKMFFEHLTDDVKMVYKISGRYYLTDSFDLKKIDLEKFNFLSADRCVHTTFYALGGTTNIKMFPEILGQIEQYILHTCNDIEHGLWTFVDHNKINWLEKLHCQGRYSSCDKFYEA